MTSLLRSLSLTAILGGAGLASCATPGSSVEVQSQATGSAYFSLGRPAVYKAQGGLEVAGRVCRRARTTLLSPDHVRVEHLSATGDVVDVAHASIPAISRRADQACASYLAKVGWTLADGETLRACFDRGRACPSDPAVKAVVAAPASPAPN